MTIISLYKKRGRKHGTKRWKEKTYVSKRIVIEVAKSPFQKKMKQKHGIQKRKEKAICIQKKSHTQEYVNQSTMRASNAHHRKENYEKIPALIDPCRCNTRDTKKFQ